MLFAAAAFFVCLYVAVDVVAVVCANERTKTRRIFCFIFFDAVFVDSRSFICVRAVDAITTVAFFLALSFSFLSPHKMPSS